MHKKYSLIFIDSKIISKNLGSSKSDDPAIKEAQEDELIKGQLLEIIFEFTHGFFPAFYLSAVNESAQNMKRASSITTITGSQMELTSSNNELPKSSPELMFMHIFTDTLVIAGNTLGFKKAVLENALKVFTSMVQSHCNETKTLLDIYLRKKPDVLVSLLLLGQI